jgi:hypothetical protein
MVALAGASSPTEFTPGVVAGSIKNLEGPHAQVFPCFIVYPSLPGTQSVSFQFTVSPDTEHSCRNGFADNPLIGLSADSALIGREYDARDVTVGGRSVVVAGTSQVGGGQNFIVRAYDGISGELRWTDQTPAFAGLSTGVFATSSGETVFATGYSPSTPCCSDILVRAYDAGDGRVLWTDIWNRGRDDLPQGIAASRDAVVVVGYGGNTATTPISALDFVVRAFHPATGEVLWEDRVDNGFLVDDAAWAVTIDGTGVFVAGTTSASDGRSDLVLRAYDVTTGTLFWETSRTDTPPPTALFVVDGRLFVSGSGYLLPFETTSGNSVLEDAIMAKTVIH